MSSKHRRFSYNLHTLISQMMPNWCWKMYANFRIVCLSVFKAVTRGSFCLFPSQWWRFKQQWYFNPPPIPKPAALSQRHLLLCLARIWRVWAVSVCGHQGKRKNLLVPETSLLQHGNWNGFLMQFGSFDRNSKIASLRACLLAWSLQRSHCIIIGSLGS